MAKAFKTRSKLMVPYIALLFIMAGFFACMVTHSGNVSSDVLQNVSDEYVAIATGVFKKADIFRSGGR